MIGTEVLGWIAASLMLATFLCKRARTLRSFAIIANLAFIAYGMSADLHPVAALHLVLLPVNVVRLLSVVKMSEPALPSAFPALQPFDEQFVVVLPDKAGD